MNKTVACLHAHHSNIRYIEEAFSQYPISFHHIVNPIILYEFNKQHNREVCKHKLEEQIQALLSLQVDAILITCTTYSGLFNKDVAMPVIKIDEPFLDYLRGQTLPIDLIFTNPATVPDTINRLHLLSEVTKGINTHIIPHAFDLLLSGKQEENDQLIGTYIDNILASHGRDTYPTNNIIAVAQLSMVNAADAYAKKNQIAIVNPLDLIKDKLLTTLNI